MNDEVSRDDDRDPAEDARTPRDEVPRGGEKKAGLFSRMFGKQPQPSGRSAKNFSTSGRTCSAVTSPAITRVALPGT